MKHEEVRKIVLSKYKKGEGSTKIYNDLNGEINLRTIERWCKMIRETGNIKLYYSTGRPRTVRTKKQIRNVKHQLKLKKRLSSRKLARINQISRTSVQRILKHDLQCKPYKKIIQPLLTSNHLNQRKKFANWIRTNFNKEKSMKILFSDEKIFDINGVYNVQNDRIWSINRKEANKNGGIQSKRKFPQKVMVWLGVCSKGISPLVIFDKGTINHDVYIKKVLKVALKYGNKVFEDDWTFQQDGATPHTHAITQKWCYDNFPSFIDKDHWPANSPDLNPLDYSIWDQLAKAMKWNKITSKKILIKELKLAVKRIPQNVVFESCNSWTKRLYRLSCNNYSYLQ